MHGVYKVGYSVKAFPILILVLYLCFHRIIMYKASETKSWHCKHYFCCDGNLVSLGKQFTVGQPLYLILEKCLHKAGYIRFELIIMFWIWFVTVTLKSFNIQPFLVCSWTRACLLYTFRQHASSWNVCPGVRLRQLPLPTQQVLGLRLQLQQPPQPSLLMPARAKQHRVILSSFCQGEV